jgi:hypothetical protein
MDQDINCPHCGTQQSDVHNGGDPGPWWNNAYLPDGDCDVECDECGKPFVVEVEWTPVFTAKLPDEG